MLLAIGAVSSGINSVSGQYSRNAAFLCLKDSRMNACTAPSPVIEGARRLPAWAWNGLAIAPTFWMPVRCAPSNSSYSIRGGLRPVVLGCRMSPIAQTRVRSGPLRGGCSREGRLGRHRDQHGAAARTQSLARDGSSWTIPSGPRLEQPGRRRRPGCPRTTGLFVNLFAYRTDPGEAGEH
jgi:hypothetical protein